MTIRTRLAVQFMLLASLVLGGAFVVVYLLSAAHREEEFLMRMHQRGMNTATLLIQVEEVDERLLAKIGSYEVVRLPEEEIRIFNNTDQELFRSAEVVTLENLGALLDEVRAEGAADRSAAGRETHAFLFSDGDENFVVIVSGRDIYGRSKLQNQLQIMFITFLVGVLLTFVIGRFYAARALAPLKRLVSEVGAINEKRLSDRLGLGDGKDEIGQLARSFNDLLGRLERAFHSQRNFITNASHELRTPLTAISGQLEVLLLQERDAATYKASVASVLDDMRVLNRLSDRLLLLAQADTVAPGATFIPVRIDEVIWSARADLLRNRPGFRVNVAFDDPVSEDEISVIGNENLLRSLVLNLMENACKYSPDNAVDVSLSAAHGSLRMEFLDRGIGIPAADRDKVFQPFFRASNAVVYTGHGIGLSLVQRIAELHRGKVSFMDRPNGGTIFSFVVPHL